MFWKSFQSLQKNSSDVPLNAFRHCRLVISAAFLVPTEIRSGLRHVVTLCHVVTSPKLCRNYLHTEEVVQNPWFRQMARCNVSAFSGLTMLKRFNRIVSSTHRALRLADQWRHTKDNPSNSSVQLPCHADPCHAPARKEAFVPRCILTSTAAVIRWSLQRLLPGTMRTGVSGFVMVYPRLSWWKVGHFFQPS